MIPATVLASPAAKLARLKRILAEAGGAVVAFSGGADSAFLADVAHEVLGNRALAATAVSPSLAPEERAAARALALARGWRHLEVETRELAREGYRANGADRCYECKTELLEVLGPIAAERGWQVALGTNADDVGDFRPGMRAAREGGARSPLLEAGLGKAEIRALSAERGLQTSDKPASACLASRIAYGVEVTAERLERVARAEAFLRGLGLRELRARDHGDLVRVEVPPDAVEDLARAGTRERIASYLKGLGWDYVTLDLEGFRSGSMNEPLLKIRRSGPVGP